MLFAAERDSSKLLTDWRPSRCQLKTLHQWPLTFTSEGFFYALAEDQERGGKHWKNAIESPIDICEYPGISFA